jgi:transcriptional regulator with XRE-family HTH domain
MPPSQTQTQPGPWIPRVPQGSFGERLRLLRYFLDLPQETIAASCGVPAPTWATWERGVRPRRMDEQVDAIATATGVDRNWLMWGIGSADHEPDGPDTLGGQSSRWKIAEFRPRTGPTCPDALRPAAAAA